MGRANTLKAIGDLERKLGNLDTARALYNDAIQLFKKVHSDLGRANALKSLGDLEVLAEKHLETEQYYLEALRLYQKEQGTVGVINTKISIVRMILKFGDTPTTSDAQAWYQKALETAKLTGSPFYIEFVKKQEKALFG